MRTIHQGVTRVLSADDPAISSGDSPHENINNDPAAIDLNRAQIPAQFFFGVGGRAWGLCALAAGSLQRQ
jgi:hypothetical protein